MHLRHCLVMQWRHRHDMRCLFIESYLGEYGESKYFLLIFYIAYFLYVSQAYLIFIMKLHILSFSLESVLRHSRTRSLLHYRVRWYLRTHTHTHTHIHISHWTWPEKCRSVMNVHTITYTHTHTHTHALNSHAEWRASWNNGKPVCTRWPLCNRFINE